MRSRQNNINTKPSQKHSSGSWN